MLLFVLLLSAFKSYFSNEWQKIHSQPQKSPYFSDLSGKRGTPINKKLFYLISLHKTILSPGIQRLLSHIKIISCELKVNGKYI